MFRKLMKYIAIIGKRHECWKLAHSEFVSVQLRLLVCYFEFIEGYDSRITSRMAEINF